MKKITILLLSALLLLCSCGSELHYVENDTTDETADASFTYTESDDGYYAYNAIIGVEQLQYANGYLYIIPGTNLPLYRYNVKTGNVTCVCKDPLCSHDNEECPFNGNISVFYLTSSGELYYNQRFFRETKNLSGMVTDSEHIQRFMRYNLEKETDDVIEVFEGGSQAWGPEIYTEDYRIYGGFLFDANTNETLWGLRKMNLSDGSSDWFAANKDAEGNFVPIIDHEPIFSMNKRIYFNDGQWVYSLDEKGENRINHAELKIPANSGKIRTDGEYIYYQSSTLEDGDREVRRISLADGKSENLGIVPAPYAYFTLTEQYIYYFGGETVTLGKADIPDYASKTVELNGGEIWRCSHDGSGAELVYTFSGETAGIRPLDSIIVGNYMYCFYTWWEDHDGDGVYEEGDNGYSTAINGKTECTVLRIDLDTGENFFITVTK